jgi:uncharacterized lipoprotein YbaY
MQRRVLSIVLAIVVMVLSGCVTGTGTGVVSGSLVFTAEPPPPAGEMVTIEIYSFERVDGPATFVSRAFVPSTGGLSVPFAIAYDKSKIIPKDTYIVQAYISREEGRTAWRSDLWNLIITHGRPTDEVELRLQPN